jgi:hypothetical protein
MLTKQDVLACLSISTIRFFGHTISGNFIHWAERYYDADMPQIVEDLTPFVELNATQKVLQRLGEFDEILSKSRGKGKDAGRISASVKENFDFNKVFALKTSTKILATLLNL